MIDKEARAEYWGEWIIDLTPKGIEIRHTKREQIWDEGQNMVLIDADFENIMKNLFWILSQSKVLEGTGIVMSGIIQARNVMCGTKMFDKYSFVAEVEYEEPENSDD